MTQTEIRRILEERIRWQQEGSSNAVELSRYEAVMILKYLSSSGQHVCGYGLMREREDMDRMRRANNWLSGLIDEALKVLGESPDATGVLAAVQILNRTTSLSDAEPGVQI